MNGKNFIILLIIPWIFLMIIVTMNKDIVREGLLCLQEEGWSDLIDSRWKDDVIKEIKGRIPNISDEDINEILKLVLV
jgi:hypothetical protein